MADRLSPLDVSFLYLEESTTPMHVGGVAVFQEPAGGLDRDRLMDLIRDRISLVPRYRQRVRSVPGRLASPVWVDDEDFDIEFHVRRSMVPRPGTDADLRELVGRVMSRPLDRGRPLWELYLVEGLSGGRFALMTKTHHALVDGATAIDIGQVILDPTPEPRIIEPEPWHPRPEPSSGELVAEALADLVRSPALAIEALRSEAEDMRGVVDRLAASALGLLTAARTVARPPSETSLNAEIGTGRRYGMAAARLEDIKSIRKAHGGTVNDVVLAVVAGGLRAWLMTRGDAVTTGTSVKALVPVSIRHEGDAGGNHVAAFICALPVGEPQPVVRLHRVTFEMEQLKSMGQAVAAEALVGLAGFAPPTLHSLGARSASELSRRMFNLVVSNVPGPQFPLYASGARMLAAYPVVPLAKGQIVSVGVTSYDGGMYFGLNADREAMPDVDVLAECLEGSIEELLDTVPEPGPIVTPNPVDSAGSRALAPDRKRGGGAGSAGTR